MPTPKASANSFAGIPYRPAARLPSTIPTTITSVEKTTFEATLIRKLRPLNEQQLARLRPGRERGPEAQRRQLAPHPEQRPQQPDERDDQRRDRERDDAAAPPEQYARDHENVQDRREQAGEIEDVVALLARKQAREEPERKADGEPEHGEDERQLRCVDVPMLDVDDGGQRPGKRQRDHDRDERR